MQRLGAVFLRQVVMNNRASVLFYDPEKKKFGADSCCRFSRKNVKTAYSNAFQHPKKWCYWAEGYANKRSVSAIICKQKIVQKSQQTCKWLLNWLLLYLLVA